MIALNYHHLYYFWTAARLGTISAASRKLYLSQPALSGQLKELERSMKAQLLARGRKGVTLTPEGRAVFERCERIFAEGEELAAFVQNGLKAPGVLRVGLRPTVTREVVLRVLRFARALDPACRVALFSGEAEDLALKLKQQSLDLLIANGDLAAGPGRDFRSRLVGRLPVFFVANRRVKRLVKRFPADLSKTVLLLRPRGTAVRHQVEEYLRRKRIDCVVEADSDDVELLRRLALEGRGVAALSALSVAAELESGRLAALHSSPTGIHEPIWFICRAHPSGSPAVRRMIESLMRDFAVGGKASRAQGQGSDTSSR